MREGFFERRTKETEIKARIVLDGAGNYNISTPIPFLTHMLELFSKHGLFDLEIVAKGDVDVDFHHTVEDIGIVLGRALKEALREGIGIKRFGFSLVPMDESLCLFAVDLSGRSCLVFNAEIKDKVGGIGKEALKEFFGGFVREAKCALHINLLYGEDTHHMIEAIFKSFGIALRQAVEVEEKRGIPSTKGVI